MMEEDNKELRTVEFYDEDAVVPLSDCYFQLQDINMPGKKYNFLFDDNIVVGRNRIVDDMTVSRQHCLIERKGCEFYISDLGSTHGTKLNGEKVEQKGVKIKTGDILAIGKSSYRVVVGIY